MEDQVPSSTPPAPQPMLSYNEITPEVLAAMKARAKELAIQQVMSQPPSQPAPSYAPQPQVVYLRRNFTVAELILILALACGLVTGIQAAWNFGSNVLPRLEIRVK